MMDFTLMRQAQFEIAKCMSKKGQLPSLRSETPLLTLSLTHSVSDGLLKRLVSLTLSPVEDAQGKPLKRFRVGAAFIPG